MTTSPIVASSMWKVWGLEASVVVTKPEVIQSARSIIDERLREIDLACSRFRNDSEIRAIENAGGMPVDVSSTLARLIRTALDGAERTDGAVDPTIGTAVVALGYDRDFALIEGRDVPIKTSFVSTPQWTSVRLDGQTVTVPSGVQLDLGATAKALAADECAHAVSMSLDCGVLVCLGGDIATAGPAPDGGWIVLVQDGHDAPADTVAIPGGTSRFRRCTEPPEHRATGATGGSCRCGPPTERMADGRCGQHRQKATLVVDEALWALGRGTGITALVFLTVSMILGIVTRSGRALPGLPRFGVQNVHRAAALIGVILVVVHMLALLADPYAQLKLVDFAFPFLGNYRAFWLGLGTLAFDVLFAVSLTGLLRNRIGNSTFRLVHWSAYALWPIAFAHGLGNGTDSGHTWFLAIAIGSAVAVTGAVLWRIRTDFVEFSTLRLREGT